MKRFLSLCLVLVLLLSVLPLPSLAAGPAEAPSEEAYPEPEPYKEALTDDWFPLLAIGLVVLLVGAIVLLIALVLRKSRKGPPAPRPGGYDSAPAAELETRTCPFCGARINSASRTCPACGSPLKSAPPETKE